MKVGAAALAWIDPPHPQPTLPAEIATVALKKRKGRRGETVGAQRCGPLLQARVWSVISVALTQCGGAPWPGCVATRPQSIGIRSDLKQLGCILGQYIGA